MPNRKVMTVEELRKDALKNPKKYVGKVVIDDEGMSYLICDVGEEGFKTIPLRRR